MYRVDRVSDVLQVFVCRRRVFPLRRTSSFGLIAMADLRYADERVHE